LIALKIFGATFGIEGGNCPHCPPWLRAWDVIMQTFFSIVSEVAHQYLPIFKKKQLELKNKLRFSDIY